MFKKILKRLKSPVVWASIAAQIGIILTVLIPQISEEFKIISTAVLEIITVVAVLNNPDDRSSF